jgi:hypothetical protein
MIGSQPTTLTENVAWIMQAVTTAIYNVQVNHAATSTYQSHAYREKGELALSILKDSTLLAGSTLEAEALTRNLSAMGLVNTIAAKYVAWRNATLKAEELRVKYKLLTETATETTDFTAMYTQLLQDFSVV